MKKAAAIFSTVMACLCVLTATAQAEVINGAGATFPYPLYSKWISEYQKVDSKAQINYQSIGSGGGIRQFLEGTVDFGATDAPMTDELLSRAKTPVLHIPTVLGAVVVTYNVKGIEKGLKLPPDVIADIYLGRIKTWNDPRIVAANKGVTLPSQPIVVVRRSDGSGTTAIFTDFLAKVSPEWKTRTGSGTAVNWPVGLGGRGNEGVSAMVKQTPGAIGYVELVYAESNGMAYAAVLNKKKQYVLPSMKSVSAAAGDLKKIPADYRVSLTDADGADAYPISGFTYILVYRQMPAQKGQHIVKFLQWALKDGQKLAAPLHYAPLPQSLAAKVQKTVSTIEVR